MNKKDMSISNIVRIALKEANMTITDLARKFGVSSAVMMQKFRLSNWNASDLARVAEYTGGKLVLVYANGHYFQVFADRDVRRKKSDENAEEATSIHENGIIPTVCYNLANLNTDGKGVIVYNEAISNAPLSLDDASSCTDTSASSMTNSLQSTDPRYTGLYRQIAYSERNLNCTPLSKSEYISPLNKNEIIKRADEIIKAEAPIRKDILIKKIQGSFNLGNSNDINKATEAALGRRRYKFIKSFGESVFCWEKDANPDEYRVFRMKDLDKQNLSEVCPHELKNAICYVLLQHGGTMDEDDLISEVARLYGHVRVGKNIKELLKKTIQFSKRIKAIEGKGQLSIT